AVSDDQGRRGRTRRPWSFVARPRAQRRALTCAPVGGGAIARPRRRRRSQGKRPTLQARAAIGRQAGHRVVAGAAGARGGRGVQVVVAVTVVDAVVAEAAARGRRGAEAVVGGVVEGVVEVVGDVAGGVVHVVTEV